MIGEKESADEVERALIEARIREERINEANHTTEKETSPFVHLIAEMKYEICSYLSDSEKFELLKSTNLKLTLTGSDCLNQGCVLE